VSVINKMLRDLDSRQVQGAMAVPGQGPAASLTRGTFSVDPQNGRAPAGRGRHRLGLLLLLVLAAGGAAAWWQWLRPIEVKPMVKPTVATGPGAAAPAPAPLPVASAAPAMAAVASSSPVMAASASLAASVPVAGVSAPLAVAASAPLSVPVPPMPEPAASLAARAPVMAAAATATPSSPAKPVVAQAVAAAKSPPTKQDSAAAPATQRGPQAAALETLAQAQSMWNAGSREVATETLREAVALAERNNLAGAPGGMASFVMLVRELCRMELAEGHASQVMALLTRLEPQLADQADIWALRGNAAQRLGRHQESASAYLAALKLRAGEPRWMLGAAVSLAALGQTAAAGEWADKARAAGVVSPEVLNYLRQMGVPLRDR
jgi:hypothetical protein